MLLKFASMFLANIFYYSEIVFEIKKRNARPLHFRILINKIYDIYFKIHCCLTNLELRHGVDKLIFFFLNFLNTIPCWYARVKMLFLLHLISLSIFLTNSAASLGLFVFLIDCSNPLVSISSSLLLMRDSRNFCNIWSLFDFGRFLVSSDSKN